MTDYCLTCFFEDYDGAEEPCINCVGVGGKRPSEYFPKKPPKPITNADRIRAMSDEELAGWLERIRLCCTTDLCGRSCPFAEVCYSNAEAPKETLDWLKQEAE